MKHSTDELIAMSNDERNKLAGTLAGYTIVKGKNPEYEENPRRVISGWDSRLKPDALFLYKNGTSKERLSFLRRVLVKEL